MQVIYLSCVDLRKNTRVLTSVTSVVGTAMPDKVLCCWILFRRIQADDMRTRLEHSSLGLMSIQRYNTSTDKHIRCSIHFLINSVTEILWLKMISRCKVVQLSPSGFAGHFPFFVHFPFSAWKLHTLTTQTLLML